MRIVLAICLFGIYLCHQLPLNGGDAPNSPKQVLFKGEPQGRMVFYTGHVQGVGFRAKVTEIARKFPVTGWVKNLSNGKVQLQVEGPVDAVDIFLERIRTQWQNNINKVQIEAIPISNQFKDFRVVD